MADNTKARRLTNLEYAKLLIKSGVYVFPSSGKVPLIPRFNKIDTQLTQDEREQAIEEYEAKHGHEPIHVGATKDPAVLSKMFKRHMDCVWSIATGPSKLTVIDADAKDGGPEKIAAHFEVHGLPEGCVIVPTQSGGRHYYFSDPEGKFNNSAGALKSEYGCDVRGRGGQCISPGSTREDGKTYGTRKDLIAFLKAYTSGSLPQLPEHVVELIGTGGEAAQDISESEYVAIIKHLEEVDWPEFDELFDPTIGIYDLEALRLSHPEYGELYDNPAEDKSDNRWDMAELLLKVYPMPVEHFAVFLEKWEGAGALTPSGKGTGNYRLRDIAKEWRKNAWRFQSDGDVFGAVEEEAYAAPESDEIEKPAEIEKPEETSEADEDKAHVPASGDAMGPVEDTDEEDAPAEKPEEPKPEVPPSTSPPKPPKTSYLEDIMRAELRHLDWAVKYFIARGTTSIVSGLWGAGKTAVYTDIALHIAHGVSYRGRKVKKGVVIYVALENAEDVERRIRTWCAEMQKAGHDISNGAFVIHRGPCGLYSHTGKATPDEAILISTAKKAEKHYGLPVSMIVIDTLSQAIAPGNDREHGGVFTASMQRITNATGACTTALHHPTKAGEAVRGDSALQGNVDTIIEVGRDARGNGTIKAGSKFRIGDPAKVHFTYRLKPFEIGRDEDDDSITVVLAVDDKATGEVMGAVTDDDDEPGEASDALTAEQNRQDEEKRITLLAKVREAMSEPGVSKVVGNEVHAPLAEIERRLPVLAALKKDSGTNYARELKLKLFRGEPMERLDDGWLRYQPGTGNRRPTSLIFAPKL